MPNGAVAWKGPGSAHPEEKQYQSHGPLIRVPFRHLALVTVSLPLAAFIFCIFWSLWYHFEHSTATHCRVANFLPSISAAIGSYTPQRYVWRVCIGLHAAPRFLVASMYGSYFQNLLLDDPLWQRMSVALASLHALENACLLGLTYVSSSEYYPAHEKFFIIFVSSALTYMFLSCTLPRIACRRVPSSQDVKVLRLKSFLALANVAGATGAVYFFVRHNRYCEPGVYTMFALCEYVIVLSNMGFHLCAFWDFRDQVLSIGSFPLPQKVSTFSGVLQP